MLMVKTDGQDGEIYQIVPKRGKSLFASQEGLPYGRRRPPHDETGHGALNSLPLR